MIKKNKSGGVGIQRVSPVCLHRKVKDTVGGSENHDGSGPFLVVSAAGSGLVPVPFRPRARFTARAGVTPCS